MNRQGPLLHEPASAWNFSISSAFGLNIAINIEKVLSAQHAKSSSSNQRRVETGGKH